MRKIEMALKVRSLMDVDLRDAKKIVDKIVDKVNIEEVERIKRYKEGDIVVSFLKILKDDVVVRLSEV